VTSTSAGRRILAAVAAIGVLLAAAVVSPALGGPDPLSLKEAKKVFVKKKSAKKKYLTKADAAAAYLTPAKGNAAYLPAKGALRVPIQPSEWVLVNNGTGTGALTAHEADVAITAGGTPNNDVDVFGPAHVPSVLGGRPVSVSSLEVCYEFGSSALAQPILDRIALQRVGGGTDADPVNTVLQNVFVDDSGRVDSACATVGFPPVQLAGTDSLGIGLRFDFPSDNTLVRVGRASLNGST
jgi:hypothetical protein